MQISMLKLYMHHFESSLQLDLTPKYGIRGVIFMNNLKIETKLPKQHSMLDHHRPASKTPFKWRFAGRPLMTR